MTPLTETGSAQLFTVASRYETLRRAALGEALPPQARSGLILFLRRGMWGWTRLLTSASARQEPISAPTSSLTAPGEPSPLVHVFAAMAMYAKDRRVP